jgi:ribosomal protein L14
MIRVNTEFKVKGNSGAKDVRCVKILNNYRNPNRGVGAGANILVLVLSTTSKPRTDNRQVEVGKVYKAIVIAKKKIISIDNVDHEISTLYAVIISLIPVENWS